MRKIGIPLYTPVLLYKSGGQGVYITRTCFHDVNDSCMQFTPDSLFPYHVVYLK